MEEDKKKLHSEEPIATGENTKELLPTTGIGYTEKGAKEGERTSLPEKITTSFAENIISTIGAIKKKYNLDEKDSVIIEAIDENGQLPRFTPQQKKILLALQSGLTQQLDEPEIKEYSNQLAKGITPKNALSATVNLRELCKKVYGEKENGREEYQNILKAELKNLSEIKRLQIYELDFERDGEKKHGRVKHFKPYINLTGEEVHIEEEGGLISIGVVVQFARIFLDKVNNRYFLPKQTFWEAKTSKGKRIKTDEFITLASLAINLSWGHYQNLKKKKSKIDEIVDPESREKAITEALTHAPITFESFKERLYVKMEKNSQKQRFKYKIWEAAWALINEGILSEKTDIDFDKETITLVFNEDYNSPKESRKTPGGKWAENPFEETGKLKEKFRKKK